MTKKKETPMEGTRFFETLRKVLLASVGAMALATDEAEELISRLVEKRPNSPRGGAETGSRDDG